jgi:hypothetical protein
MDLDVTSLEPGGDPEFPRFDLAGGSQVDLVALQVAEDLPGLVAEVEISGTSDSGLEVLASEDGTRASCLEAGA